MQRVFDLQKLLDYLAANEMSERAFARATGLDKAFVHRVLNGQAEPGLKFILRLWAAFPQLPLDFFLPTRTDTKGGK